MALRMPPCVAMGWEQKRGTRRLCFEQAHDSAHHTERRVAPVDGCGPTLLEHVVARSIWVWAEGIERQSGSQIGGHNVEACRGPVHLESQPPTGPELQHWPPKRQRGRHDSLAGHTSGPVHRRDVGGGAFGTPIQGAGCSRLLGTCERSWRPKLPVWFFCWNAR